MKSAELRRAFEALASDHGLPVLQFMQDRDWTLASQVAEGLGIHTSTACKHLAAFYDAGFLERRPHSAKRPTHAYRLRSPVIRIEFDLAEPAHAAPQVAEAFLDALLTTAGRMVGPRLSNGIADALFPAADWRAALRHRFESPPDPRAALDGLVRDAGRACAALVGAAAAARLVRLAIDHVSQGRSDLLTATGTAGVTA